MNPAAPQPFQPVTGQTYAPQPYSPTVVTGGANGYPQQSGMPAYAVAQPGQNVIKSHLVGSILSICFGVMILGIIATVMSSQVGSCISHGDYTGAQKKAKTAFILNIVSFSITAVIVLLYIAASIYTAHQ